MNEISQSETGLALNARLRGKVGRELVEDSLEVSEGPAHLVHDQVKSIDATLAQFHVLFTISPDLSQMDPRRCLLFVSSTFQVPSENTPL